MNRNTRCKAKTKFLLLSATISRISSRQNVEIQEDQIKNEILSLNIPSLGPNQSEWLNQPFSVDEVKEATFQIGPLKAPGIDGKPGIFY